MVTFQAHQLLASVEHFLAEEVDQSEASKPPPALLLCGDLNGEPIDGVVEYINDGCVRQITNYMHIM